MTDLQLAAIGIAAWCAVAAIAAALVCTAICRIKKRGARK